MRISVIDLLNSVQALQSPGVRIGFPDDSTLVDVVDAQQFCKCLDAALRAFQNLRSEAHYVVDINVSSYQSTVCIRFMRPGPCERRNGRMEPALEPAFLPLHGAALKNAGDFHYSDGNNYFELSLPYCGSQRQDLLYVKHLPWDERYRLLLERSSWESLREKVFRFSKFAELFAARCAEFGKSRVLIPSVGLCVHPWLFANQGLSVIATDRADAALTALSEPASWPRLYSRGAFERWDIQQSGRYGSATHPDQFAVMPDLTDPGVRETLKERIAFVIADWADLPLEDGCVDAIFATNALPRESVDEQVRVLKEWIRLVRPGGMAFIAQHNFFDLDVETVLQDTGWVDTNLLGGKMPSESGTTGFQVRHSSG